MELIFYGIIVGLAISIPMGSVGVSVIHRVLTSNRISALVVGSGSVVADSIFGIIAVYGLNNLADFINEHKIILGTISGICLFYISIRIFISKPKNIESADTVFSLSKDFATGFILTITNPLTAIAVFALFAWFKIDGQKISIISGSMLITGLIIGLILWWLTLTEIAGRLKNKLKISSLKIINQIFGIILLLLAILIMARIL